MFYILFLIIQQIYLIITSINHYLKKRLKKEIKKVTFIRATLDNFLEFINSPSEFRTSPKCNIMKGFERYFFTCNNPYPNITRTFFSKCCILVEGSGSKENLRILIYPQKKRLLKVSGGDGMCY